MKEYALYKGEICLAIGTIRQIARELKLKERTVRFYMTPSYIKRRSISQKGNYRILIKLDSEE